MTPEEIRARLQADAQARGIDLSAMWAPTQDMPLPSQEGIDLVSYIQSIADGIASASESDVLAMIQEILTIKQSSPSMDEEVPLDTGADVQMNEDLWGLL